MHDVVFAPYSSLEPRPWKNGRGITRNLFDDANEREEWTWRISIAEISGEQPYSAYPGVHRDQVALGPGAARLTIDGASLLLPVEGITSFEGEAEVSALPESDGFLDMNVMTRRDRWATTVVVSGLSGSVESDSEDVLVLVALRDDCDVAGRRMRRLDAARWSPKRPEAAHRRDGRAADSPDRSLDANGRFVVARLRGR